VARALPIVLLVPLALLVAGCGSKSDKDQVRSTVQTYIDGLASKNGKKVCDQLAPSVQTLVKQRSSTKDCATAINKFEASSTGRAVAPAFNTAKIKEVTAKGSTASATLNLQIPGGSATNTTIPLEKVNGKWKITAPAEG
jgi:outer membrane murein-binding lipoprotein Lpp